MKKSAMVLAGLFVCSSAFGQSLSERTNEVTPRRTAADRNDTTKSHLLGVLLYTDVTVQFQEMPARDAFNYLQTMLGIRIVGRYSADRIAEGIDPDMPVTLDMTNRPAREVLEMMLAQCEEFAPTTWQIRHGYIEVGTKERLSAPAAREIRVYPIRDLLFEPTMFDNAIEIDIAAALNQANPGGGGGGGSGGGGFGSGGSGAGGGSGGNGGGIFGPMGDDPVRRPEEERAQDLIDLVQEIVEPDQWSKTGGEFTMKYYQGSLIVRAPDYVHRQLGGYPPAIRPGSVVRGN